ncbi:MAG: alpha-amylase/alpha-mannosidase [Planctomycetes bacterium]|nr:alpha-amylase/alpha-mannosidase [Planctomycetota bacterium]
MHDVSLAFFWHQHQPYYPDDVGQENPMPWVRLHGTKDYWGMAMLLKEVPELHATINLVPSLLKQLLAYTDGRMVDTHLRVSRLPADGFSEEDSNYLLDNFFLVHAEQMIRPYRRYDELHRKRGFGIDPPERARKRFSKRDLIDLQVWSNLVWIHPIAFELDPELAEFRAKGRHWTEEEKLWLLEKQMELLAQVIPLHRELQKRGQLELTTSPFYHPILPLLWDKRQARRAMPDVALPKYLDGFHQDAPEQIRRGVAMHEKLFGQKPRGMWPSEGSVCQGIVPAIADAGIHWIATDEEILSCSTDGWVSRDDNGFLRNPEMLYRPWRVQESGRQLEIVFRDHAMSDQIGFHYQRFTAEHAVDDFCGKVEAIGRATNGNAGHRPTLLTIILDGENCWEYYPNGGVDFLRALYRRVAEHPKISPVRIGDYVEQYPAADKLNNLFPGSWIQHNFGIWIGHPECNRAWDLLHQTRQYLVEEDGRGGRSPEQLERAWEELYIAEGSDWFWWFGDSHTSAQDALFDHLFRKHLQNVYLALDEQPPGELSRPISQGRSHQLHTQPTGWLQVKVNGRRTYFEWINAGHCVCQASSGAMAMVQEGLLADLYFGFDQDRLLIRLDARGGPFRERLNETHSLRVLFFQPEGFEVRVTDPGQKRPRGRFYRDETPLARSRVDVAADLVFELAVPWRTLGARTDDPIQFYVELIEDDESIQRVPHEGAIETFVPSPDYELVMWQV